MKALRLPNRLMRLFEIANAASNLQGPPALLIAMLRQLSLEAARTADLLARDPKKGGAQ